MPIRVISLADRFRLKVLNSLRSAHETRKAGLDADYAKSGIQQQAPILYPAKSYFSQWFSILEILRIVSSMGYVLSDVELIWRRTLYNNVHVIDGSKFRQTIINLAEYLPVPFHSKHWVPIIILLNHDATDGNWTHWKWYSELHVGANSGEAADGIANRHMLFQFIDFLSRITLHLLKFRYVLPIWIAMSVLQGQPNPASYVTSNLILWVGEDNRKTSFHIAVKTRNDRFVPSNILEKLC